MLVRFACPIMNEWFIDSWDSAAMPHAIAVAVVFLQQFILQFTDDIQC